MMKKKNELTLVPIGGLANRFYAVTSAISFCRENNRTLKVVWFRDHGMGAGFHQLFRLQDGIEEVRIIDAAWGDYIYDRPRRHNLWWPAIPQKLLFDHLIYEKQVYDISVPLLKRLEGTGKFYLVHFAAFYPGKQYYHTIYPVIEIQEQIAKRTEMFKTRTVGIHIRRTDHSSSISKSPINLFTEKMDEEILRDENVHFYVASDSPEEKQTLIHRYGDRILTTDYEVRRDTVDGMEEAVVELYTLAATDIIYGSFASTYSSLAAELFNKKLKIILDNK